MLPQQRSRMRKIMARLARTQPTPSQQQPPAAAPPQSPQQQLQQGPQASEEAKPASGEGETQVCGPGGACEDVKTVQGHWGSLGVTGGHWGSLGVLCGIRGGRP